MTGCKVKIQYGILSGELAGGRLRKALRQAGFKIVRDAHKADIVFAHSAGCFWLTNADKSQKFVLVDPPYWPGKSIRQRLRDRSRSNAQFRQYGYTYRRFITRNLRGTYYAIKDMRRTIRIMRYAHQFDLPKVLATRKHVVLVRNEHDDWLTPHLESLQQQNPHLQIKQLPGDHDHITHHPQSYVDLLQSLYG